VPDNQLSPCWCRDHGGWGTRVFFPVFSYAPPETSRARLEPDDYGWDHGGRGLRVSRFPRACLARDFPCPAATAVQRLLTGTTAGRESDVNQLPARDHSVRAVAGRRLSWHNSIGSNVGLGRSGSLPCACQLFRFADFCGAVRRNARGLGAIADFLPLVFAQRPVEHEQLLLHQQRAMPDDFRNWRLLLPKPLSSAFAPGPDQAVTLSSPGWRAVQLLNEASRQVGAHQSRAVRAKPSAPTRERSPGGRLDAGVAGVHVPKQETLTGADVGIQPPAALPPELTGADAGIRPPADPGPTSPKTPE
jgi:hypothetical protein